MSVTIELPFDTGEEVFLIREDAFERKTYDDGEILVRKPFLIERVVITSYSVTNSMFEETSLVRYSGINSKNDKRVNFSSSDLFKTRKEAEMEIVKRLKKKNRLAWLQATSPVHIYVRV